MQSSYESLAYSKKQRRHHLPLYHSRNHHFHAENSTFMKPSCRIYIPFQNNTRNAFVPFISFYLLPLNRYDAKFNVSRTCSKMFLFMHLKFCISWMNTNRHLLLVTSSLGWTLKCICINKLSNQQWEHWRKCKLEHPSAQDVSVLIVAYYNFCRRRNITNNGYQAITTNDYNNDNTSYSNS